MNEKKIIRSFFIVLCVLFSFHFSGCKTTGKHIDSNILEYQRRITELENTNRALTERLRQYDTLVTRAVSRLEIVRERAASIGDTADRIEYLFNEYERAVQQLIHELRSNSGAVGMGKENYEDIIYYLALLDGSESFTDYCRVYFPGYK